jgi:hypothetical protein
MKSSSCINAVVVLSSFVLLATTFSLQAQWVDNGQSSARNRSGCTNRN